MPEKSSKPREGRERRMRPRFWIPFYTEAGPINAIKGIIGNWPYLASNPAAVHQCCNGYTPETVKRLNREGVNVVFVSWSVGFSMEAEKVQRDLLLPFVKECRHQDIKVIPYLCSVTMFHEEFFKTCPEAKTWKQLDVTGRPILYHNLRQRMQGCLRQPEWRRYVRRKICLAIEAALDGIYLDNPMNRCYCARCRKQFQAFLKGRGEQPFDPPDERKIREILSLPGKTCHLEFAAMDAVANRRPHCLLARRWLLWSEFCHQGVLDFLLEMASFVHKLSPQTPISCNGAERPSIYKDMDFVLSETPWFPNFENGQFRSNLDLMHTYAGESNYTKPVVALQGGQDRTFRRDDPRIQQLALAEGATFSVSICAHHYSEFHAPEFTRFFKEHESLFLNKTSVAPLGVIMPHVPSSHLPDILAEANILYDRLVLEYLPQANLSCYRAIIIDDMPQWSQHDLRMIMDYTSAGGHVLATGCSGMLDERWCRRTQNPFAGTRLGGIRYCASPLLRPPRYFMHCDRSAWEQPQRPVLSQKILSLLEKWGALAPVAVHPKRAVIVHVVRPRKRSGYVVHCLNYDAGGVNNLVVTLPFNVAAGEAIVHRPGQGDRRVPVITKARKTRIPVGELEVYAVVEMVR